MKLPLLVACGTVSWMMVAGLAATVAAGERVLWAFADAPAPGALATTDAVAGVVGGGEGAALRVVTGTRETWPGVTLRAPEGRWDLSAFAAVEVRLRNAGTVPAKVFCRVDNPGADGRRHCVTGDVSVGPGAAGVLRIPLTRTRGSRLDGRLFGMRGYPVETGGGEGVLDPAQVTQVLLFLHAPGVPHVLDVASVRAAGEYLPPTASVTDADPFFPFIDTFGQYRHRDWPGKIRTPADLEATRRAEDEALAAQPELPDRGTYGGWTAGPRLRATGYFRVDKVGGKWWLVDPDGWLFWSHGVDCVRMLDATPVAEREDWFEAFPGDDPAFAAFVVPAAYALKGHYAGRSPRCFSFAGANLQRKYGAEWRTLYPDRIHRRLRAWGLNTIANWSDAGVAGQRRTPYTDNLHSRGARVMEGSEGYWAKFPDVFDPRFAEGLAREMAGKRGRSAGDPWCLGYFSDNEMSWGDDLSLAEAALRSPPDQPAKQAFLEDLRERHATLEALNAQWGTAHATWEDLRTSRDAPDRARARADLEAFYTRCAETYFRTVRDAIREVAPHQLYLGCRFAWGNARAAAAAAKYCDVVSYNLYQRSVADFACPGGAEVPLIIGEFHFGALDRGMFHTGLVPVASQAERARAYREYVEGALRHPQFVGTHWFQWQDEPTTGRVLDEENYQIGLIDIADTPYRETVEAVRDVGASLYTLRFLAP